MLSVVTKTACVKHNICYDFTVCSEVYVPGQNVLNSETYKILICCHTLPVIWQDFFSRYVWNPSCLTLRFWDCHWETAVPRRERSAMALTAYFAHRSCIEKKKKNGQWRWISFRVGPYNHSRHPINPTTLPNAHIWEVEPSLPKTCLCVLFKNSLAKLDRFYILIVATLTFFQKYCSTVPVGYFQMSEVQYQILLYWILISNPIKNTLSPLKLQSENMWPFFPFRVKLFHQNSLQILFCELTKW